MPSQKQCGVKCGKSGSAWHTGVSNQTSLPVFPTESWAFPLGSFSSLPSSYLSGPLSAGEVLLAGEQASQRMEAQARSDCECSVKGCKLDSGVHEEEGSSSL
jgi:hypothetical protein